MLLLLTIFFTAQFNPAENTRWTPPDSGDVFIEDSLGEFVDFATDYNYSNGNIYAICLVDSGNYFGEYNGLILFQSTDHGQTWAKIYSDSASTINYKTGDVDLVVTREDTLFASFLVSVSGSGTDNIEYYKFFEESSGWDLSFLGSISTSKEFKSQKLIRDDFDPFYLYRGYIIRDTSGIDSLCIERSMDQGATWIDTIYNSWTDNYSDLDMTVSDSTLYVNYIYYSSTLGQRRTRSRAYRGRGLGPNYNEDIYATSDTTNENIHYSRIGATTTTPDNGQLVYTFYCKDAPSTGGTHLLYKFSDDGGQNWSIDPDTMFKDSAALIPCDLRGYQAGENPYMNFTYHVASGWYGRSYWRWANESNPADWSNPDTVTPWMFLGVQHELVYSPGSPGSGSGVIYSGIAGGLWFDAPWITSGINVVTEEDRFSVNKNILHSSDRLTFSHPGVDIFDVSGRKVRTLSGKTWNLKDNYGQPAETGIYFIKSKETGESEKVIIVR